MKTTPKIFFKTFFLFLICFSETVSGQIPESDFNCGHFDKFSLSPGLAGYNKNIECFLNYEQNRFGIAGSPRVETIGFNAPLDKNSGYGLQVRNRQNGNFTHFELVPTYAYKLKLSDSVSLSMGLNSIFYRNQLETSKIRSQGFDPQLQNINTLKTNLFDFGISAVVSYRKLLAGVYSPYIISSKSKYKDSELSYLRYRKFNAFISYPVVVHKKYGFDPVFILRTNQSGIAKNISWTSSVLFKYKTKIWTGVSISSGYKAGLTFGGAISDKIILNYSYQLGFTGIEAASSGSHEFTIGFLIKRSSKRIEPTIFPENETVTIIDENTQEIEKLKAELALTRNQSNKILNAHKTQIEKLTKKLDSLEALRAMTNKEIIQEEKVPDKWDNPIILSNVKFGDNSDKLFSSSFSELNKVVAYLLENPKVKLEVSGFSDVQTSQSYNQYISERRAEAVALYIVRRGIDKSRITSEGKGEGDPKNPVNPKGSPENTRIEIRYTIPQ